MNECGLARAGHTHHDEDDWSILANRRERLLCDFQALQFGFSLVDFHLSVRIFNSALRIHLSRCLLSHFDHFEVKFLFVEIFHFYSIEKCKGVNYKK